MFSNESVTDSDQHIQSFFRPVDPILQDSLFEKHKFSLNKSTPYFCKRHRIAQANLSLLAKPDRVFFINPFDDNKILVTTKEISDFRNGSAKMWILEKLESRIDVDHPQIPKELKKPA